MYIALIILIVIAAALMCFIVLIQNSKGGGLASSFASSNQIMGVRKTTDILEKTTWSLAAFIVVLSIASAHTLPSSKGQHSAIIEASQEEIANNPQALPGFDASALDAAAQESAAETPAE